MEQLQPFIEPLRLKALDSMPQLNIIEEKTTLKPSYALLVALAALFVLSPVLQSHYLLTSLVCYVAPAYLSFLALESADKEDDIKYLNYWVIFALTEVSTPLLKLLLNKFFYMVFRVVFTLLLLHPKINLSTVIYNSGVRPLMARGREAVDEGLTRLQGNTKN